MRNITVSVPDEVYRAARIRAAERDTSVSALVAEFLRSLADREEEWARLEALQKQVQAGIVEFRGGDRLDRDELQPALRFVDTNVLLYAVSTDPGEKAKTEAANELLASRDLALSVQVLQEFYVQATRESRPDRLTHEQAARLVDSFLRFPIQELTVPIVLAAQATRHRFRISYWDAAILEAARAIGCEVVLSEDLGDGQEYGGVRVENPFR